MKYLAVLFSVYMTLLALIPCQDKDDQGAVSFDTTISKSGACNEHAGQEICPPFCTCNCCSTARYIAAQPVLNTFTQQIVRTYSSYTIPVIQQQSLDIWQPPQIV